MQKLVKPFERVYVILRNCKRLSVHLDRDVIILPRANGRNAGIARWSFYRGGR